MQKNTAAELADVLPMTRPRALKALQRRQEEPIVTSPVLVIEPEPLLAEMLIASLRLHRAALNPRLAQSLEAGLAAARDHDFRLVVVDVGAASPGHGAPFLAELHHLRPLTPVLALAESSTAALSALLDFDVAVVTKPPDIDHLLRRVDQLLERRAGGLPREISLAGLLQMLELERKTCRITASSTAGEGRLWLTDGELAHAETAAARGVEALFQILGWEEPVLRIVGESSPERSVHRDLRGLLLRFCVEQDHRHRDLELG